MAAHTPYLLRRGATLVFRRRLPNAARPFFRKKFFVLSLRTHLLAQARRRAAIATRFTDDLIGLIEACGADMLIERQMDAVVDELIRFEIAAAEALRETAGPRAPDAIAAAVRLQEATRETLRAALVYNDFRAAEAPLARTLARLWLAVGPGAEDWPCVARRAARALIEVAKENLRREQGIYASDGRRAGALAAGRGATPAAVPVAAAAMPVLPPAPAAPSATPIAEMHPDQEPEIPTVSATAATAAPLVVRTPAPPAGAADAEPRRLPDTPPARAIAADAAPGVPASVTPQIERERMPGPAAVQARDLLPEPEQPVPARAPGSEPAVIRVLSPESGVSPSARIAAEAAAGAGGDKLKDLLATSAFVVPLAKGEDPHIVFWPTLLAAHAGLREEEALQLTTDDIDIMQGVPILRIQSGEGQLIKGGRRCRIIPIHRNLIALGFLRFVEERRRSGQLWLFPEVERCAAKGRLSGTFTKTFTRYRIAEGVYDPRRDFHSLRTHFNVELKRDLEPVELGIHAGQCVVDDLADLPQRVPRGDALIEVHVAEQRPRRPVSPAHHRPQLLSSGELCSPYCVERRVLQRPVRSSGHGLTDVAGGEIRMRPSFGRLQNQQSLVSGKYAVLDSSRSRALLIAGREGLDQIAAASPADSEPAEPDRQIFDVKSQPLQVHSVPRTEK